MSFDLALLHADMPVTVYTPLGLRLSAIDRVTNEFVFVDGGKYCRRTGKRIGTGGDFLMITTNSDKEIVHRGKLARRILGAKETELLALETAELEAIVKLLDRGRITGKPKKSIVPKPETPRL